MLHHRSVYGAVKRLIASMIGLNPSDILAEDRLREDLRMPDTSIREMTYELNSAFGIALSPDDVQKCESVRHVAMLVRSKT